jgi:hypothetical protein
MNLKIRAAFIVSCLCLVFIATPAYGYIDPNASGLISQILTPLLIVGAASITFLRKRVVSAFSGLAQYFRRRDDASRE